MKSVENIEPVEEDRWKQKYFDALKDLESQEARWIKTETLLRRSISHLSLLGDGLDSELDDALTTLRSRIRNESDIGKIRSMVDAISKISERVGGRQSNIDPVVPSAPLVAATDILLYLIDNYGDPVDSPLEQGLLQKRAENADSYEALTKVADVRRGVQSSVFSYHGNQVSVTISCGLAEFHSADTPESVLNRADDALYRAKKNGRNRCEKETF